MSRHIWPLIVLRYYILIRILYNPTFLYAIKLNFRSFQMLVCPFRICFFPISTSFCPVYIIWFSWMLNQFKQNSETWSGACPKWFSFVVSFTQRHNLCGIPMRRSLKSVWSDWRSGLQIYTRNLRAGKHTDQGKIHSYWPVVEVIWMSFILSYTVFYTFYVEFQINGV